MDKITATNIDELNHLSKLKKKDLFGLKYSEQIFKNLIIDFELDIDKIDTKYLDTANKSKNCIIKFKNCDFNQAISLKLLNNYELEFSDNCSFTNVESSRLFNNLTLIDSSIQDIDFEDAIIGSKESKKGKVRFRNCELHNINFRNTKFNHLADFWQCTFNKPTTFYKTDFNATTVFSAATFKENVLFTYTSFNDKAIFGRTKFLKGLDISQTIISGELLIFDLSFEYKSYEAEYVGSDNKNFQNFIDNQHKIPQINKVTTFQILKNQYAKQGNHIDEVTMRKEEKKAFYDLTQSRKEDINLISKFYGDRLILWFNRKSNHYKSDFRNGITFTLLVAILFLFLTLATTGAFWNCFFVDCKFDSDVIGFTIKSFINFLNPAHNIDYLNGLKPFYGIPYIFDFLGRIAVGYGIYQTVQAFRKYK